MATHMIVPILGESISEAVLVKWWKEVGDTVKRGEELAEIETAKANMALECPANGVLLSIVVPEGETIRTGDLLAIIGKPGEALPDESPASSETTSKPEAKSPQPELASKEKPAASEVRISPAARKLAGQLKIDLAQIQPSAPGRRIMSEDVQRFYDQNQTDMATGQASPDQPESSDELPGHHVPLTEMRRLTGQRMLESVHTIPQFSISMDADVTHLRTAREAMNQDLEQPQDKISLTALLIYLTARTLQKHIEINARFDGDRLWVYDTINMAVAITTPRGLAAPVIPKVEQLSLHEIARKLNALVESARSGRLSPAQMSRGTFSISNLGMQRVTQFTPLVNPPQAAILGIASARPAVLPLPSGGTQHTWQMSLTLSADHRVVDGAGAANFLSDLCREIETFSEQ